MGGMFDYIEITKYIPDGYYDVNNVEYGRLIGGKSVVKVAYNKYRRTLTIKGSLPYFVQGHNFYFDLKDAQKAVAEIGRLLDVDLSDADVRIMEYGIVICPDFTIADFMNSHLTTKGYKRHSYEDGGLKYIKTNKAYSLKFYSLWSNIDDTINKLSREVRIMLKGGKYRRENNPMRYEIHGNPDKIIKCGKISISKLFTEKYIYECQRALLQKYKEINKRERLYIEDKRTDSWTLALTLLSEYNKNYKEDLMLLIERTNNDTQSRTQQKKRLRDKIKTIPHKKCSYSIEKYIIDELASTINSGCKAV